MARWVSLMWQPLKKLIVNLQTYDYSPSSRPINNKLLAFLLVALWANCMHFLPLTHGDVYSKGDSKDSGLKIYMSTHLRLKAAREKKFSKSHEHHVHSQEPIPSSMWSSGTYHPYTPHAERDVLDRCKCFRVHCANTWRVPALKKQKKQSVPPPSPVQL